MEIEMTIFKARFPEVDAMQFKRENFIGFKIFMEGNVSDMLIPRCIGGIASCKLYYDTDKNKYP